jgi:hypothetical protein
MKMYTLMYEMATMRWSGENLNKVVMVKLSDPRNIHKAMRVI